MAKVLGVSKILDHPEKDKIIGKLINGDDPKEVANYLKLKYPDDSQSNLRISANILSEFQDKYLKQYDSLTKILSDEKNDILNHKIAESLLNNKTWKERIAENEDVEIDLKKTILQTLCMIKARSEQVFDKIQENPDSTKADYVLINYFKILNESIDKADKLLNNRPDKLIQQNITIQMVEQHSAVFQEAIKDILSEFAPDLVPKFLDLLSERMMQLNEKDYPGSVKKEKSISEKLEEARMLHASYDEDTADTD